MEDPRVERTRVSDDQSRDVRRVEEYEILVVKEPRRSDCPRSTKDYIDYRTDGGTRDTP